MFNVSYQYKQIHITSNPRVDIFYRAHVSVYTRLSPEATSATLLSCKKEPIVRSNCACTRGFGGEANRGTISRERNPRDHLFRASTRRDTRGIQRAIDRACLLVLIDRSSAWSRREDESSLIAARMLRVASVFPRTTRFPTRHRPACCPPRKYKPTLGGRTAGNNFAE